MSLDLAAIADWNAANKQARRAYHLTLNRIEAQDPSLCIEQGCDELRMEDRQRCVSHLITHARARKAAQRANSRAYAKRNPDKSAERVRRFRARQKEKK